jgi:hypothetical protein
MSKIRGYLIEDINKLDENEIHKLYKYVRIYLIADIPELKDPLERIKKIDYVKCAEEINSAFLSSKEICNTDKIIKILESHF